MSNQTAKQKVPQRNHRKPRTSGGATRRFGNAISTDNPRFAIFGNVRF